MTAQQRTIVVGILTFVAGALLGAGWQYISARPVARELAETRNALGFQRLEATLGAATIEAQRGSYEIARQLASDFFTGLQSHVADAPAERQGPFEELLAQRDAMITALSRGDVQSGPLLAQMFVRYRIAMGEPVGPAASTASPPAPAPEPATTGQ